MIISTIYNIGVFTMGGLSGSVIFILIHELDNIREGKRILSQINNISRLLNTGFYAGSASALFYIITGKPFVEYLLE